MIEKRLLTVTEMSCYASIPVPTLYSWVCLKKIPYVKIGRCLRFDKGVIDRWLCQKEGGEIVGNATSSGNVHGRD